MATEAPPAKGQGLNKPGPDYWVKSPPNKIGQHDFWAEDSWMYDNTKAQGGVLSKSAFKNRYSTFVKDGLIADGMGESEAGLFTKGLMDTQYEAYTKSYAARGEDNLTDTTEEANEEYWSNMQKFVQSMPGYEAYSQYIPKHLQNLYDLEEGGLPQYPGQLEVGTSPYEGMMLNRLGGQMFGGGIDKAYDRISEAYKGAFEDYQPALKRAWEENTQAPAQERLRALGLEGSSPGMEFMGGLGQDYAIQEAALGRTNEIQYAQSLAQTEQGRRQAFGQDAGMMQSILGGQQTREAANIQTSYQDFLNREMIYPMQALGLGGQAFSTSAGAIQGGMAQAQGFGQSIYDQQMGQATDIFEMNFMAPYLDAANQPISTGGGKGK